MKKTLALFDEDVFYATRLLDYIKNLKWEDFDILLFTKHESLADFLNYQRVEILICGNSGLPEDMPKENIKYIFYLCENPNCKQDDYQLIFKYQPAGKIVSDIVSCYTKLEDVKEGGCFDEVRFISVFSPVPGAEKSTFAWALAKELSDKRKVLFIPLEMFPTDFIAKSENENYAMSEYLYYLKENSADNTVRLKPCLNYSEKLSYLSGLAHGFDLLALNKEDSEKFIRELNKHKEYEIIIFYIGLYTEAFMELLKRSDQIYIAVCDLPYEESVFKEWERQMALIDTPDKLQYHKLKLPTAEQLLGPDCFPEYVYAALRPFAKEAAQHLLN